MNTYILHIDTALTTAIAALSMNGQCIASRENHQQKDHSAFIHQAISDLMDEASISPSNLQAVAVTEGPGSYTGLRVGMSTAKGFCFALHIPLITINNLWLMASASVKQNGMNHALYCPMIDARRMEVFTAVYDYEMNEMITPRAMILDQHAFSEYIHKQPVIFSGNGSGKFKDIVSHPNAIFVEMVNTTEAFIQRAYEKYLSNDFASVVDAIPFYAKEFYNV
ncbi:MAG: tRNA (adenosine(37)-N6)-threonylcarbamoyltransferase complex dimerization subunit type 1 TsaB [Ferruginibacter sp.]|nr:tRNA (adenosine(37)-N6)-threonylcarbamoyltransferase complex dimerization subunit type 1 TsaB [Ferruginibacter sp.]